MKLKSLSFVFLIFFLIVNLQCKAPRNNPMDPLNPDYEYGTIEGLVQSVEFPFVAIPNVKVLWQNTSIISETNVNGRFKLNSIPIKDGNIIFSKDGYKPDTIRVTWGSTKNYFTQVYFNRIPLLDSVSIYTVVINQAVIQPSFTLVVKAVVTDADRDIDSVFVLSKNINLKKSLTFSPGEGLYQTNINESELLGKSIEETIGHDFSIIAKDKFQNEFNVGSDRVTRIIKNEVTGLLPSTDSSIFVSNQPVILRWNEFDVGFEFDYLIELYSFTFQGLIQLVETKPDIPADSTKYTLNQNLSVGNYYWVIWVKDKFQNQSRSKQVNFRIVSDPLP